MTEREALTPEEAEALLTASIVSFSNPPSALKSGQAKLRYLAALDRPLPGGDGTNLDDQVFDRAAYERATDPEAARRRARRAAAAEALRGKPWRNATREYVADLILAALDGS